MHIQEYTCLIILKIDIMIKVQLKIITTSPIGRTEIE